VLARHCAAAVWKAVFVQAHVRSVNWQPLLVDALVRHDATQGLSEGDGIGGVKPVVGVPASLPAPVPASVVAVSVVVSVELSVAGS